MYKSAPSFFLFSLFGTTNCFSCFELTTKLAYSTFHRTLWRSSSRAFVVRAFPKHLFLDTMKKDALTQVPMSAFEEASKKDTTMKEEHKSSRPPISKKSRGASTENGRTPKKKQKTPSSNTSSPPENEIPKENMSSSKGTLASKVTSKKTEQSITERDPLPKLWSKPTNMFKIISWNVNGIRAVVKNYPNALSDLVKEHKPDLICLQETKLQECHVTDPKLKLQGLLEAFGYDSFWSCSTEKKGYSGTAVFVKRCLTSKTSTDADKITCSKSEKQQKSLASFFKPKQPSAAPVNETATDTGKTDTISNTKLFPFEVSYGLNNSHDPQGRCITVDYPLFSITNAYVPNSGDGLVRLDYRTKQWDVQFAQYMKAKEETRGVPVIMIGDLNVGTYHMSMSLVVRGMNCMTLLIL